MNDDAFLRLLHHFLSSIEPDSLFKRELTTTYIRLVHLVDSMPEGEEPIISNEDIERVDRAAHLMQQEVLKQGFRLLSERTSGKW